MAASNSQGMCKLCLCCKLIEFESMQKNDILQKVKKYLLIQMEQNTVALCEKCYNSLEDFHKFYENVHSSQKKFHLFHNELLSFKSTSTQTWDWTDDDGLEKEICENKECEDMDKKCGANLDLEYEREVQTKQSPMDGQDDVCYKTETIKPEKEKKQAKQKEVLNDMEKKMVEFYNIKCEKCENITFTSFKMLSRHYSTVHNTQGYIKCCKRNIRVNDKSYLKSHMFKHLEPDSCRCNICGKQLSSTLTLRHHMILHKPTEERPFQCGECDKRFCCKNDLKNHEKAIHTPDNEREDFICDACGKVFQKVANLRYHHSTVHLQERKYVCELCAKSFTTQSGLKTHRNAAHYTKGPIQCQECNKWLKNAATFQKHLELHQNNSYPCSQCNKICNSSTSLRSHMVKHSEERPYICNVCQKSFKTKTHLKNHSVQHSGGSNFKCPFCPKTFVNMSNYYTHRKRMHFNPDALKADKRTYNKAGDTCASSNYTNNKNNENEFSYRYKILKDSDSVIPISRNDIVVTRQNIIVSPMNNKYL